MKQGFIKVAAATVTIKVADTEYNTEQIIQAMDETEMEHAKVVVFPELCITGYTCGELFLQELLIRKAKESLLTIAEHSKGMDGIFFVGLPVEERGKLFNCGAVVHNGQVLALIPKTFLPNYGEFYEKRYFTSGYQTPVMIPFYDRQVPMGTHILIESPDLPELKLAAELCEDLWTPCPPSIAHALAGATIIVNLSASDEVTGKEAYRRDLVKGQSARLICGYVYASAGEGESTMDVVYSGHNLITENGTLLAEGKRFENGIIYSEIDVAKMNAERRRVGTFESREAGYLTISVRLNIEETKLTRYIDPAPFVPGNTLQRENRCSEIFTMQYMGLKKRLSHIGCRHAVIGISGGLDSTLALLVTVKAFDALSIDRKNIHAVTMPGFGTTGRTYENSLSLIQLLGADLKEIDIKEAVNLHFQQIGQKSGVHDVTYENSQARQRTMLLMNLANLHNGIVIGTGDMSELALGWATYNGDHMSMYGVNVGVPKTLVRHLVSFYGETCGQEQLRIVLEDVLDTPVSPELLPPDGDGKIAQKTEAIVGPYELHDFFLYYVLRFGFSPRKIFRLALVAFQGSYQGDFILKWLHTFYRRFFSQQFKRSCLPDGPKIGSVAVSPRGDLRMPSDASVRIWEEEIQELEGRY
ncbi:MAG: NAD(+) synthase [Lachnospiraceae bacterium]